MKKIVGIITACVFVAAVAVSMAAAAKSGPTTENLMAAEDGLAKAMRENNPEAIESYLADDYAVINGHGGIAEGKSTFPDGIKSGYLTRNTFDMSETRVRMHGDMAWVTFKLHLSGTFGGKAFDVMERETDVWTWKDGGWKCVLSHETLFPKDGK